MKSITGGIRRLFSQQLFWLGVVIAFWGGFLSNGISQDIIYDEIGYHSYLTSLIFDHDLDLSNDLEIGRIGFVNWNVFAFEQTITGAFDNKFSIGPAIFWSPFFIIAHLIVLCCNSLGANIPTDGIGMIYKTLIILGTQVLNLMASLLLLQIGNKKYNRGSSLFGVFMILSASFWSFYVFNSPFYSHALSISASTFFCWVWDRYNRQRHETQKWLLGLASAALVLIRWQNLILVFAAMLYQFIKIVWDFAQKKEASDFLSAIKDLFAWGTFLLIGVLPQSLIWFFQNNTFFLVPQGVDFMHWTRPNILGLLFSDFHGLFFCHPILLLGIAGMVCMKGKHKHLSFVFFLSFVLFTYVNGVVDDWWAGLSFGMRRFDALLPFFGIGLMQLWEKARSKFQRYLLITASILAVATNIFFARVMIDPLLSGGFPLLKQSGIISEFIKQVQASPLDFFARSSPFGVLITLANRSFVMSKDFWGLCGYLGMLILTLFIFIIVKRFSFQRRKTRSRFSFIPYVSVMLFISGFVYYAGSRTDFHTLKLLALGRSVYLSGNLDAARTTFEQIADSDICEVAYLGFDIAIATQDTDLINQIQTDIATRCGPGGWLRALSYYNPHFFENFRSSLEAKLVNYATWHPNQNGIMTEIAAQRVKSGEIEAAIDLLTQAHNADPEELGILVFLGTLYQSQGDLEQAKEFLERSEIHDVYADVELMKLYNWQGDENGYQTFLQDALKKTTGDPGEDLLIGLAASERGDTDVAFYRYFEVIEHRPQMTLGSWYPNIGTFHGKAWMKLSEMFSGNDKRAACVAALESFSYAVDSYHLSIELSQASTNLSLARDAMPASGTIENYDLADWYVQTTIVVLKNLLTLQKVVLSNRVSLGSELLEQGYEVQARDVLLPLTEYFHPRSALQPLPDTSEIRDLATDYYEDKDFEIDILLDILEQMEIDYREMDVNDVANTETRIEDIEILEDIVYRFNSFSFWWTPKDITDAYLGRANAFLCLGSAEDYYETLLLAQSRGQNDVRIDRALSNYEAAGDPAAAETRFAHALEMEPGNYFLLLDYGFFNEVNEDHAEAEAIYRKAIDINPGYAVGYKMLGICWKRWGTPKVQWRLFDRAQVWSRAGLRLLKTDRPRYFSSRPL